MGFRWRRPLLIAMLALAGVLAGRLIVGPISSRGPIGACYEGDVGPQSPGPFARANFSGTVVGLAASGGGSRAAYLEAAILREIRRAGPSLRIGPSPRPGNSLLDQIDAISTVSGGSLAGGYYVLNAARLQDADAGSTEWTSYLEAMAHSYRLRQWFGPPAWNPATWFRYTFTDFNRGVLARDDYDTRLFRGARLADLPERPALFINAFDVANHVRFVLSKHYVDTLYLQPRDATRKLAEPQTLFSENDLTFTKVNPASVSLAEAVYASSAFPLAYPNLPMVHCGNKILYQGQQIFLADGALADNSGLITLMTQLQRWLDPRARGSTVVAIYIDASVDRIDNNGTRFQQLGIEDKYAWHDTITGHGIETIFGAVALMQDVGWKLVQGMDVVTDQLTLNWPNELTKRQAACAPTDRTSWTNLYQSGALSMRPLVMRLGLRDVVRGDFVLQYGGGFANRPELAELLERAGVQGDPDRLLKGVSARLQAIPTDFTLTDGDRKLLDLVAFLLVHGKLASNIALWNEVYREVSATPPASKPCG